MSISISLSIHTAYTKDEENPDTETHAETTRFSIGNLPSGYAMDSAHIIREAFDKIAQDISSLGVQAKLETHTLHKPDGDVVLNPQQAYERAKAEITAAVQEQLLKSGQATAEQLGLTPPGGLIN